MHPRRIFTNRRMSPRSVERIADVIFAVVLGCILGAAVGHWISR